MQVHQGEIYGKEQKDFEDIESIYIKLCEERAESMGECEDEDKN